MSQKIELLRINKKSFFKVGIACLVAVFLSSTATGVAVYYLSTNQSTVVDPNNIHITPTLKGNKPFLSKKGDKVTYEIKSNAPKPNYFFGFSLQLNGSTSGYSHLQDLGYIYNIDDKHISEELQSKLTSFPTPENPNAPWEFTFVLAKDWSESDDFYSEEFNFFGASNTPIGTPQDFFQTQAATLFIRKEDAGSDPVKTPDKLENYEMIFNYETCGPGGKYETIDKIFESMSLTPVTSKTDLVRGPMRLMLYFSENSTAEQMVALLAIEAWNYWFYQNGISNEPTTDCTVVLDFDIIYKTEYTEYASAFEPVYYTTFVPTYVFDFQQMFFDADKNLINNLPGLSSSQASSTEYRSTSAKGSALKNRSDTHMGFINNFTGVPLLLPENNIPFDGIFTGISTPRTTLESVIKKFYPNITYQPN